MNENNIRESELAETPRLMSLLHRSAEAHPEGLGAQIPSIVSFVGPTGAGKSVLIRSIISLSAEEETWKSVEAPVPGEKGSTCSTTGEVNLYPEPSSPGTKTPTLIADCEGVEGSKPVAANYQEDWKQLSRKYPIQNKEGRGLDRTSIAKNIYPRFLYIFSDVICYVTREQRSWANATVQLLEWSSVGAQHAINQYTLPALIIILNNSGVENEAWVSDDRNILTKEFFTTISEKLNDNDGLRNLAMKRQNQRLLDRIKSDSRRVQEERAKSWTQFDSQKLPILTELAFNHLATGAEEPFDFGSCRRKTVVPHDQTLHLRIAEFLRHDLLLVPSTPFSAEIQEECKKALNYFYDEDSPCGYIDPKSGKRCVNTKSGHSRKGHQDRPGQYMRSGDYVEDGKKVTPESFINSVKSYITDTTKKSGLEGLNRRKWRELVTTEHRKNMEQLRESGIYPQPGLAEEGDPFRKASIAQRFNQRGHNNEGGDRKTYSEVLRCSRILSLDGGGVSVISQLVILQKLESRIGLGLPIGDFFDLIVRASTGGIAALALGIFKNSATEFIPKFNDICTKSFAVQYQPQDRESIGSAAQVSWLQLVYGLVSGKVGLISGTVFPEFLDDPSSSAKI
ncbi:hypothetical protein TWF788_003601 [Orbilia oligospora]|uniref:PNPLA domain-containing protein n=1 Tax=Orbilia oligospora TaxID=2813651 RepID=A0A7C8Q0C5_ORBOL|nr:hypothetical protein TWF788_003601 [Orbilia oligospora]